MTATLDRLIAEREPDPDILERERLTRVRPYLGALPKRSYHDPAFYEPFERVVCGTIAATIAVAERER